MEVLMNKLNYKLLNKIGSSMLAQFPPDSFVEASNEWKNKYYTFLRNCEKQRYKCLLNNHECNGMAINSHSIPQKDLKNMCIHNKVAMLKDDFKNPFKSQLSTSYIKSTLTFPGFCQYHDTCLFQKIENKSNSEYDNEDIFFLSYRALAKEYSDNRDLIDQYSWMLKNWESRKRLDKEWALFSASKIKNLNKSTIQRKMIYLVSYFSRRVVDKFGMKFVKKECQIRQKRLQRKLETFNNLINGKEIFESHYTSFQNENQIAFSFVCDFSVNRKEVFLYFTSLPQKEGSFLIISCNKADYGIIKGFPAFKQLFSGDERIINDLLNECREKIAINETDIEVNYPHPFFLEWEIPLAKIPYFKLKRR